jgi:hypothetical protein
MIVLQNVNFVLLQDAKLVLLQDVDFVPLQHVDFVLLHCIVKSSSVIPPLSPAIKYTVISAP